ncbi:MAG: hypothetical protein QOH61_733 [Chloroflexota bacterium]|nr:hypothetical protein [Chloroflexota bacterium]
MNEPRAGDLDAVKAFVDGAAPRYLGAWFADLAVDDSPDSIALLRATLLVRSDDLMGKHYIPRVAAWALLRRGPAGVATLADLGLSPDTPGAIYPAAVIDSLWWASLGRWTHLLETAAANMGGIDLGAIDQATKDAARRAITDLVAESPFDAEVFDRLIGVVYASRMQPDGQPGLQDDFLALISRATIKVSQSLLDEFEHMLGAGASEETHQKFLADNPVLLDPLASMVVPKQRLGTEFATDFVVRRLDDRFVLVEIERPDTPIMTRAGDFSAQFTHAFGQVLDFQRWVEDNSAYADRRMPGIASPRGLLVIGMRSALGDDHQRKLRRFIANSATIDVLGFDDVLQRARHLYENLRRDRSSLIETPSS